MLRRTIPVLVVALAVSSCATVTGADLTQPGATATAGGALSSTGPPQAGAAPTNASGPSTPGLAIVLDGGAPIHAAPGGNALLTAHEGLIFPITAVEEPWLEILDSCSNPGWVNQSEVQIVPKTSVQAAGADFDLSRAIVVVDAGHGGRDWGAPGPGGSRESDLNIDIADRLRDLLLSSHDINWETGAIGPGQTYASLNGAWMTRDTAGPDGGDFEAGLAYRAEMANSVGADALVAIHNNTGTDRTLNDPPSAVFYAVSVSGSDRLASLIDAELSRSFNSFAQNWQGSGIQGTAARVDAETGTDFYGLLRRSEAPAVIIEGAYVSDPEQERLLESTVFRQAYAEGVYRGLIRFFTTSDIGSEIREPDVFQGDVGSPSTASCEVPRQP